MRPSRRKIAEVIAKRLNSGESLSKISKETAAYLLDAGRTSELESIMRDVMEIRAGAGQVESTLTSAHRLSPKVQKEVKELVRAIRPSSKKIVLDEQVDPTLIGGLRLHVIDQSLDLSIKTKLNRLKQLTTQGGV
jgi:ATP synthase F1 delta subunit